MITSKVPSLAIAVSLLASLAIGACSKDPPLDTVSNVDLKRYQGKWFEIAKLPRATQTDCYGTVGMYTLTGAQTINLAHQCNVGSFTGPAHLSQANGQVTDPSVASKLSVDFGGGYYGDYWIIDLGANYEYAVVGHPTRQYLWILSRTSTLDPTTLAGILKRAQDKGFDTSQLKYTPQAS